MTILFDATRPVKSAPRTFGMGLARALPQSRAVRAERGSDRHHAAVILNANTTQYEVVGISDEGLGADRRRERRPSTRPPAVPWRPPATKPASVATDLTDATATPLATCRGPSLAHATEVQTMPATTTNTATDFPARPDELPHDGDPCPDRPDARRVPRPVRGSPPRARRRR